MLSLERIKILLDDPTLSDETATAIRDELRVLAEIGECPIPQATNQFYFCRKMFNEPFGEHIKEESLIAAIDHEKKDARRTIYDAMLAVNRRINKTFYVSNFFKWRNNHVWVSEKIIKK